MNTTIQLIALDLDGTLYNHQSIISNTNKRTIKRAADAGITVIISTGRPYIGLPLADMEELGIHYAITSNGAAVYKVPEKELLLEDCLAPDFSAALLTELYHYPIHIDAFINGDGFTQKSTAALADRLDIPEELRNYIKNTRSKIDDLPAYIKDNRLGVTKMTLNFLSDGNGCCPDRGKAEQILKSHPELSYVSGGFNNLELTRAGISKAKGMHFLCDKLGIPMKATMACGDSENDLDIVKAAGIGIAMSNAQQVLLDAADFVSTSNEEDGVAYAIELLCLEDV